MSNWGLVTGGAYPPGRGSRSRSLTAVQLAGSAVASEDDQEPAPSAIRQRLLGDELGWEFVVEVGGTEALSRQRLSPVQPAE